MMRDGRPGTLVPRLAGAAALAAAVLLSRSSDAGWDGSQDVKLGDQIVAEFRGDPLVEVHDYTFWAPKGTVLTAQCVVDKTTPSLVPDMNLFTELDAAVPFGATQVGNKVTNYTFAASGEYYLKLRATAGTGIYKLTTKAKFPKLVKGSEATGTFQFDALAGTTLGVTVKPTKLSTAKPNITGLTYQGGVVDITSPPAKHFPKSGTPVTKLAKVALPVNGTYTLTIDPVTAGQSVDVLVTLAPPTKVRTWAPGVVEDPVGMPSAQRTEWLASPHADHTATAFNDWNTTNPPAVPGACSRCHTTTGYQSYVGFTGTAYATPANQPIGQVIECDACHNEAASALTSVKFPSGTSVSGLGKEARCMMCHQGRESTASVEAKIATAAPGTVDDSMTGVSFMNVHYLAAGATLYGTQAMGGFEYPDPAKADPAKYYAVQGTTVQPRLQYEMKFPHVKGVLASADMDTCIGCHDPHSTEVRIDRCATCHVNAAGDVVANKTDLRDIRMAGTTADFDGDGVKKGVYYEIEGMRAVLLQSIKDYALAQFAKPITYDGATYPYFLLDDGSNAKYPNWSARLLKATYNYQFSVKDPGAFAHNAKYIIELLYDSIADLKASGKITLSDVAFAKLVRNDSNHFDGAAQPYTDWTEDAIPSTPPAGGRGSTTGTDQQVNSNCSRCHSVEGFEYIVASGVQMTAVPSPRINGMYCESCHEDGANFSTRAHSTTPDQFGNKTPARVYVARVAFPYVDSSIASTSGTPATTPPSTQAQIAAVTIFNGAKGTAAQDDSFVCMTCHRARESMLTVEAGDVGGLTTNFTLSTKSPHYFPAGALLYGKQAAVAYQYNGHTYAQRWDHDQGYTQPYALASGVPVTAAPKAQCTFCHMENGSHSFEVEVGAATACGNCHTAATVDDLTPFARAQDNFDNDVNTKPKAETKVFADRLAAALNAYSKAAKTAGTSGAEWSLFNDGTNPALPTSIGWYKDTNHNDVLEASEIVSANASKWDSKGYRASFNYRLWLNDPGAWAHNPRYVLQVLYDSIENLGGDLTNLTRPN